MANVHDTAAVHLLAAIAALDVEPGGFRAALDAVAPGWRGNADPVRGYGGESDHAYIKTARALYEVLPTYSYIGFDWTRDHGFGAAIVYLEQPGRTAEQIAATISAAKARAEAIAAA